MGGQVSYKRAAWNSPQDRQHTAWLSELDLRPILNRCSPFVMPPVSTDALVDVANLVKVCLTRNIPGEFVECGVWRGGTAFLMAECLGTDLPAKSWKRSPRCKPPGRRGSSSSDRLAT